MGKHGPRRARVVFYDVAQEQIERMSEVERARLDPVLVSVSRNPEIGMLSKHGSVREHREDGVRILYVPTALGTLILVAYVEA
ncbi:MULTISPECIES: hypothetical protein [unclassified Streptomyces]|uniref:hypothetical protein n=1 Tax=unclassified Streptomyces TaxID=2593676 RepID=UPI002E143BDD|nr:MULTISPECIES: hypothetical protein [unclassified Streptomyces]WSR23708.1 hypothetical protein OG573_34640 [Streptomyces sp. NBC_01205]